MSDHDLPAPSSIDAESRRLALATSAWELHGALCGWLAGGGANERGWLAAVFADPSVPAPAPGSPLDLLREATAAQLEDRSFEFELLLPAADAPLAERSGALFDWCRGFVGAFGLAAGEKALSALSAESREALADLAKLAAAEPQDDGDEEDEEAMVEIEEFVRVASLLLHGDCVLGARHRQQFN